MTLRRQLRLIDAIALYLGIVIGSGVFFAPRDVAAATSSFAWSLSLWCIGGFISACGAWVYAEAGARLPHDGGFYVFYREALGEAFAFVGGWVAFLITYPASVAAIAMLLARYLGEVLPELAIHERLGAMLAVLLSASLNLVGVRTSAWSVRVLTATKVLCIACLCIAALLFGASPDAPAAAPLAVSATSGWLLALVGVLWAYSGWSDVTVVSGELQDPARNLGRTVLFGTLLLVALHALVQLAVETLLTKEAIAASPRVVADAVAIAFGRDVSRLLAVLVVVSTFGALHGTNFVVSRLGYAMAQDRVAPRPIGQLSRFGTPAASILASAGVTLLYIATSDFASLLGMFTFSVWPFYALTAFALLRLRRRGVGEPLVWRGPRGAWPAWVVFATAVLMSVALLGDPQQRLRSLAGVGLIGVFAALYLVWRRRAAAAPPTS